MYYYFNLVLRFVTLAVLFCNLGMHHVTVPPPKAKDFATETKSG